MANIEKIFNSLQVDDIYNRTGVHARKGGTMPDFNQKMYSQKKQRYFPNQTGFKFSKKTTTETAGMREIQKKKAKNVDRIYPLENEIYESKTVKTPQEQERDQRVMQLTAHHPGMRFDIRVPSEENTDDPMYYMTTTNRNAMLAAP